MFEARILRVQGRDLVRRPGEEGSPGNLQLLCFCRGLIITIYKGIVEYPLKSVKTCNRHSVV